MIPTIPEYIQFYPTLACNYTCQFCFNRGLSARDDINVDDFKQIAARIKNIGIQHIDILGGEPTLHQQFIHLIEIITANKLKTTISTNGTNPSLLQILSENFSHEYVRVGISLNDHKISDELHDYIIRYRPILKSIYKKNGIIPQIYKHYIGMSGIEYYLLYRDVMNVDDLDYSIPFYDFYNKLIDLKKAHKGLDGVFCSGFIPDKENYSVLNSVRCPAGTTKLSILPDGSVYPCYLFFRYKEFELGNILTMDFESMWKNPILNFFRQFHKNNCSHRECELFNSCHGGCPALSYIFTDDLTSPDPRCLQIC